MLKKQLSFLFVLVFSFNLFAIEKNYPADEQKLTIVDLADILLGSVSLYQDVDITYSYPQINSLDFNTYEDASVLNIAGSEPFNTFDLIVYRNLENKGDYSIPSYEVAYVPESNNEKLEEYQDFYMLELTEAFVWLRKEVAQMDFSGIPIVKKVTSSIKNDTISFEIAGLIRQGSVVNRTFGLSLSKSITHDYVNPPKVELVVHYGLNK